jgi:phage shock protein PspC (stress-responsive transcriptional regulator)
MQIADELLKLKELLDAGALTEQEFSEQKSKLLGNDPPERVQPLVHASQPPSKRGSDEIAFSDERYRSLYRSSDESIVLGLAGGLAHKFDVPVAAMRAIICGLSCFGVGLFFYFVGIFLPKLPTKNVRSN